MSIFSIALLIFGVSQLYWAWRGYAFLAARISLPPHAIGTLRGDACDLRPGIRVQSRRLARSENPRPPHARRGAARRAVSVVGRQFILCVPDRAAARHSKRNRESRSPAEVSAPGSSITCAPRSSARRRHRCHRRALRCRSLWPALRTPQPRHRPADHPPAAACLAPSKDSASASFPTSTSAPSCPPTKSSNMSPSPTRRRPT